MKRFNFTNARLLTVFGLFFLLVGLVVVLMLFEVAESEAPPVKPPGIVEKAKLPPPPPPPPPAKGCDGKGGILGRRVNFQEAEVTGPIFLTEKPKRIKHVPPDYPISDIKPLIKGRVVLLVTTDIYGRVKSAQVVSGHPLLRKSAVKAVLQCVYEPYILGGQPRDTIFIEYVHIPAKIRERDPDNKAKKI